MAETEEPSNDSGPPPRLSHLVPALVIAYDTFAGALVMYASIALRYLFEPVGTPPGNIEWLASGVFAVVCLGVFAALRLHRGLWRHTSIHDMFRCVQAILLAHLIFLPILFITTRLDDFPRSSLALSIPLLVAALLGPRFAVSTWRSGDLRGLFRIENRNAPVAVLVGEQSRVAEVLREQNRRPGGPVFRFRGIIETTDSLRGRALHGVPVLGGLDDLERAVRQAAIGNAQTRIVLADPDPDAELVNICARIAGRTGAGLARARNREGGAAAFTQVEAADLLSRPPRSLERTGARRLISGKRVLVTGAGGTIGGELTRQAARLNPARLILLDSAESHLYEIDMELQRMVAPPEWSAVLCDVRDAEALHRVFATERPDVILHAAALKHVPLMEANASEAVLTNVFGTIAVTETAIEHEAEAVVLISTDKAVDPVSVMGATKRCAEIYAAARGNTELKTRLSVVRFGNVLASTGSVVPLFERQIEAGEAVTVTHPETTRYFMTVQESASLVLEAGAQSASGNVEQGALFLLDMGKPVPIARLARQLIRLRGKEPGRDVEVRFVGLRPGEKLRESLTHAFETIGPSTTEGVLQLAGPRAELATVRAALIPLRAAAVSRDEARVRQALDTFVSLGLPEGIVRLGGRLSARE